MSSRKFVTLELFRPVTQFCHGGKIATCISKQTNTFPFCARKMCEIGLQKFHSDDVEVSVIGCSWKGGRGRSKIVAVNQRISAELRQ